MQQRARSTPTLQLLNEDSDLHMHILNIHYIFSILEMNVYFSMVVTTLKDGSTEGSSVMFFEDSRSFPVKKKTDTITTHSASLVKSLKKLKQNN